MTDTPLAFETAANTQDWEVTTVRSGHVYQANIDTDLEGVVFERYADAIEYVTDAGGGTIDTYELVRRTFTPRTE